MIVLLTLMESLDLHNTCQSFSKREKKCPQGHRARLNKKSILMLLFRIVPRMVSLLTVLCWAKGKGYFKAIPEKKKKKKTCSDNEGFHGISVFYFLLELSGVVLEFFGSNCCLPSPALVVPVCDQPHTGAELAGARHSVLRARGVLRPRASSPCSAFWQAVCPYFER